MKKNLVLLALVCALALTGCASNAPDIQDASDLAGANQPGNPQTQAPVMNTQTDAPSVLFDLPAGYDPASEEDEAGDLGSQAVAAVQQTEVSKYAGTTPIPLDPIDMPTPTPRPNLVFNYTAYTSGALGITFEAPAGWELAEGDGILTLTEPLSEQKDGYSAQITITASAVPNNYAANDMRNELRSILATLGAVNYTSWTTTSISGRTLMDADGFYANYRGELYGGVIVRGRVHVAVVDSTLYMVHITCPGWFNESYMNIHTRIRNTIKRI